MSAFHELDLLLEKFKHWLLLPWNRVDFGEQVKPTSGKIQANISVDQNLSSEKTGTMKAVPISADIFQNRITDNADTEKGKVLNLHTMSSEELRKLPNRSEVLVLYWFISNQEYFFPYWHFETVFQY